MPYTHKKVGNKYVVYKKGKKVGETEGTKTALNKYLAALHIADKPKKVNESMAFEQSLSNQPLSEKSPALANTVEFWVVEQPRTPTDNPTELVHKADPIMFGHQMIGGLTPDIIYGFYMDEDEALNAAHDLVSSVFEAAKSLEEKKETVLSKLDKHISRLQREVNQHMREAGDNPEEADRHHEMAERKMAIIKELRGKHKMVGASKKELIKPEED